MILTSPLAYCVQVATWELHPGPTLHCEEHGPNSPLYADRLFGWARVGYAAPVRHTTP